LVFFGCSAESSSGVRSGMSACVCQSCAGPKCPPSAPKPYLSPPPPKSAGAVAYFWLASALSSCETAVGPFPGYVAFLIVNGFIYFLHNHKLLSQHPNLEQEFRLSCLTSKQ
jgi:hypothetical protein